MGRIRLTCAAALLAFPAAARAADQDSVCAMMFINLVVEGRQKTDLSPEMRTALGKAESQAAFFSGVLSARYADSELADAVAGGVVEFAATRDKSKLVGQCVDRYREATRRLGVANDRAREKLLGPSKPPK